MTNDTTTLNGALKELGETMAANLTQQGVTSTWDEGLTTLAGKILDITPGPGPTPGFDGITLTSDKSILSAADSEYATLSAQLTSSGSPALVSGETVSFKVYKSKDDTLIDTLTADTNASGLATVSYYGEGTGDLYIKGNVDSIISSEIYVEDCTYFHDMTSADSAHWTIPSSANASYSSNGMKLQGSAWTDCYLEIPLTKPYSIEFDLTQWSGATTYQHYFYDSTKATRHLLMYKTDANKTVLDAYPNTSNLWNGTIPEGSHVKIEINDSNAKLYVNDDLKVSKSYTMPSSSIFGVSTAGSRSSTWKNIKIKPL